MELEKSMEKLRMQLKRFNAALGTAGTLKAQLAADCLTLETRITSTLKVGHLAAVWLIWHHLQVLIPGSVPA